MLASYLQFTRYQIVIWGTHMAKKVLKVWQVVDSRNFGGIESHILQLSKGLIHLGINVSVIFLNDYGEHPMWAKLSENNINFMVCRRHHSFFNLLTKEQPDLIHSHGYKAGIYSRLLSLLSRTPVISTYHAGELPVGRMKYYDFIDRYTAFLANKVFAVSEKINARLPCKSTVAKNFVNSQTTHLSRGKQVAFIGRLSEEKGVKQLIKIAQQLPHTQFHVYGDGPARSFLSAYKGGNIVLYGQINDMSKVWCNVGLLLLPSIHEGLPMVLLEAMSMGIPAVASDVGDIHKVITAGQNGWLIKSQFTNGYVSAIESYTRMNKHSINEMRTNAQQTILDKFSTQVVLPDLINHYQNAII